MAPLDCSEELRFRDFGKRRSRTEDRRPCTTSKRDERPTAQLRTFQATLTDMYVIKANKDGGEPQTGQSSGTDEQRVREIYYDLDDIKTEGGRGRVTVSHRRVPSNSY